MGSSARRVVILILFFSFFTLATSSLYGQATASFSGTVVDSSGAVVPSATLTLISEQTSATRIVKTDSEGRYLFTSLQVGVYTIKVDQDGFQQAAQRNLTLEVNQNREVDFTIAPASTTQVIQVAATAVAVQTTDSTLGYVVGPQETADLPLNGRDFVQLATLTPGATTNTSQPGTQFSGGPGNETSIRGSYSLSVGGSRENSTDWLLDGVDNNELTAGAIAILPSIDVIQEFRVLTYNYSAQYGARGGPTVLVTTKSGANAFHGSAFEFARNTLFDARSFFAQSREPYHQNQFGASLGGPIKKNKTFFFMDFQRNLRNYGVTSALEVPTALMRQGIFTESFPGAPSEPIYNPYTTQTVGGQLTRTAFPGNAIPPNMIDPIAAKMIAFYPLPNVPDTLAGDYVATEGWTLSDREFDVRIDHNFSSKDSLFGRFSYDQADAFEPSGCPGFCSNATGYGSTETFSNHGRNFALSETHIFSNHLVNVATIGYNRIFNYITSYGTGSNESANLGIPGSDLGGGATGLVNTRILGGWAGIGDSGWSPFQGGTNVFHYEDAFDYNRGAHDVSFGGEIRRDQLNTIGYGSQDGQWRFDNLYTAGFVNGQFDASTGSPIASFLLGLPREGFDDQIFGGSARGRRWTEFRPFVQDNWKVRKDLTLNLGLGYNTTTATVEAHNRQTNFDFATAQFLIAGVNAGSAVGVQTYHGGWDPRIGLAWSPFGSKAWAIRAGYGTFHDSGWNLGTQGLWQNPPFVMAPTWFSDNINPSTTRTIEQGFPILTEPTNPSQFVGSSLTTSLEFEVPNPKLGTVQQFNLNIQRSLAGILFTAAYAGLRSDHLITGSSNFNSPPPNTTGAPPPYPQFGTIDCFCTQGRTRYDSLQIGAEAKSIRHGLYFNVGYTWARGFDNGLPDFQAGLYGAIYYPLPNLPKNADKGLSEIQLNSSFLASAVWNVPVGRTHKFGSTFGPVSNAILGDWQVNGIAHLTSGFPLFMTTAVNNSGTVLSNRPDRVCNGKLSDPTISEWFNPSCFVDPAPGKLGDDSRSDLYGPGFTNFDISVFKNFRISKLGEGGKLQFRSEFFNIFNHPQFGPPGTTEGAAGFGQVLSTINNPRLIQFALKLSF